MKPKFLYLNYHSNPEIMTYSEKLNRFSGAYEFLNYLIKWYEITVIDHIGKNDTIQRNGVTYIARKKKRNNKWLIPFKLHRQIAQLKPDVIYLQSLTQIHFLIFLIPFVSKKPKVLVQHHAEQPPGFFKHMILKFSDRFVDLYFFTSKEIAADWVKNNIISSTEKIAEVIEGSTFFKTDQQVIRKEKSYLWVARLNANKDPITVVESFIKFLSEYPTAVLTMVYSSTELLDQIRSIINQHEVAKGQIKLLGKLNHLELEKIYQQHVFFILASYYEGGSFSLIEAMAYGCIPIVSNIPTNRSLTNNGNCCLLFEPGNKEGLLKTLNESSSINKDKFRSSIERNFSEKLTFKAIATKIHTQVENI